MSDTVSPAVIVSSPEGAGSQSPVLPDVQPAETSGGAHVHGSAYAEPGSSGLVVEFRTLSDDSQSGTVAGAPVEPSTTVSGGAAQPVDRPPGVIAGGQQLTD